MTLSVFTSLQLAGRALSVQRTRLDVVSANLANAQTTQVEGREGPYRRRDVVLESDVARGSFGQALRDELGGTFPTVRVADIREDSAPPRLKYDPDHPDANEDGYVAYPNINTVEEMVNMITSMRTYQANLSVVSGIQEMSRRALSIGRTG